LLRFHCTFVSICLFSRVGDNYLQLYGAPCSR
jgi:hypothetical protein